MQQKLYYIIFTLGVIVGLGLISPSLVYAQVVINEVLPNPSTTGDATEWVEIYNNSGEGIDLLGWSIAGKQIVNKSLVLPADQYLIITKDKELLQSEYSNLSNVMEANIGLTNSGKNLELRDHLDKIVDKYEYGSSATDESWQRTGPVCANWQSTKSNTIGKINGNTDLNCFLPSTNAGIMFSTDSSVWNGQLQASGKTPVQIRFVAENFQFDEFYFTDMFGVRINLPFRTDVYKGFVNLHLVDANVEKVLRSGLLTIKPSIHLNEVMINPFGSDVGQEWVEISVESEVVRDNLEVLVDGEKLAGGFSDYGSLLIFRIEGEVLENCQQPSDCSQKLQLEYKGTIIDEVIIEDSLQGLSLSRDEEQVWHYDWQATLGKVNQVYKPYLKIKITEVFAAAADGEAEWVELYNTGQSEINLLGWKIIDKTGEHIIESILLPGGKYLVLKPTGITLNNTGETIQLFNEFGLMVDEISFGLSGKGESWGRQLLNGTYTSEAVITEIVTPGKGNKFVEKLIPENNNTVEKEPSREVVEKSDITSHAGASNEFFRPKKYYVSQPQQVLADQVLLEVEPKVIAGYSALSLLMVLNLVELSQRMYPHLRKLVVWWLQLR